MNEVLKLVYQLKAKSAELYLKGTDNFALMRSSDVVISEDEKNALTKNKAEILRLLQCNKIENKDSIVRYFKIPEELKDYQLSDIQQGIYLQSKLDNQANTYNTPFFMRFTGVMHSHLTIVLKYLLEKFPILRMTISDSMHYKILELNEIKITHCEINPADLDIYIKKQMDSSFDLDGGQLIKCEIVQIIGTDECILNLMQHHILSDATSMQILLNTILTIVQAQIDNTLFEPPIPELDYFDFLTYQQYDLMTDKYQSAIKYLSEKLNNSSPIALGNNSVTTNNQNDIYTFQFSEEVTKNINQISRDNNVSSYSILLTCLYYVFHVYNENDGNFPICITVSNRPLEFTNSIGPFISTLPVMIDYEKSRSFQEFVEKVNYEIIYLNEHHNLNLNKIVTASGVPANQVSDLMQLMFTMHNFRETKKDTGLGFKYEHLTVSDNVEKFGISIVAAEYYSQIEFHISYLKNIFGTELINNIFNSFQNLVANLQEINFTKPLSSKYLFTEEVYQKITVKCNETQAPYLSNSNLKEQFESQVDKTPDNIALHFAGKKISYRELNEKSNQLARILASNCRLKADDLVCLFLQRDELIIVSILAVIKAGAAYVPIDPEYPKARVNFIISDTKTRVVLTNESLINTLNDYEIENQSKNDNMIAILSIDDPAFITNLECQPKVNLPNSINSRNLAYVIYTSGTTGNPKGVMIEHQSVLNLVNSFIPLKKLNEYESIAIYSNYVFDAFVMEIFPPLLNGNQLHLLNNQTRLSLELLNSYLVENKIQITFLPSVFIPYLDKIVQGTNLRLIYTGGDKLTLSSDAKKSLKEIILYNEYGPTEITVCATYHEYKEGDLTSNIGRPINNTILYILDEQLEVVPIGACGELYIGGAGVSRGYLNLATLSQERFIHNPFQTATDKLAGINERLYKTGDLVRYLSNGDIEYIGRTDFQVKIRGFRVELGEIEAKLNLYKGIKQSLVITKEQENLGKILVAYYVADTAIDSALILEYMNNLLPEYMQPSAIIYLEKFPLTPSGKINRSLLPDPIIKSKVDYVPPRTEIEANICNIYAEVLGVSKEKYGILDDFFHLGGDSILSIQIASRLRQRYNLVIGIKDIFKYKTIQSLYDNVISKITQSEVQIIKTGSGILNGEAKLLPIQKWFFNNVQKSLFTKFNHWNQSFLIKTGTLDIHVLKNALSKLVEFHDSLRFQYARDDSWGIKQFYSDKNKFNHDSLKVINVNNLSDEELNTILTNSQSGFELFSEKPLYTVIYLYGYPDNSCRVFFAIHHLLIDVVSWRIITEDLYTLYTKLLNNQNTGNANFELLNPEDLLGKKGSSYRQWGDMVSHYPSTHQNEQNYWVDVLKDFDNCRLEGLIGDNNIENNADFILTQEDTSLLLNQNSKVINSKINDFLLTALGLALNDLGLGEINYVTLEGHGREDVDQSINITNTVGWFTTMFPLKLKIIAGDYLNSIINVKESLRSIPNNGFGFGWIVGYESDLPRISFNYLGQLDNISNSKDLDKWFICNEASGQQRDAKNQDYNLININGLIANNQLQIWTTSKLSKELTLNFSQQFNYHLHNLINQINSLSRSYISASDIGNIINQEELDKLQRDTEIENVFLANSLQQGFIYHALSQGSTDSAYRVQLVYDYNSTIDPELLYKSWICAVKHFPSLRLRFLWDSEIIQIIDKHQELYWRCHDFSGSINLKNDKLEEVKLSGYELKDDAKLKDDKLKDDKLKDDKLKDDKLKELIVQDRLIPYDLSVGNLIRINLIKWSENCFSCIVSTHHAILDGWSNAILMKYVHDLYLKLSKSSSDTILEIVPEKGYVSTQKYIQEHRHDSMEFWNHQLSLIDSYPDLSGLLKANERSTKLSEYRVIKQREESLVKISKDSLDKLKLICEKYEITINVIVQYVWHKLLNIFGNSNVTVVGTTTSGRSLPVDGIEEAVGLFINTLPLIVLHDNTMSIANLNIS